MLASGNSARIAASTASQPAVRAIRRGPDRVSLPPPGRSSGALALTMSPAARSSRGATGSVPPSTTIRQPQRSRARTAASVQAGSRSSRTAVSMAAARRRVSSTARRTASCCRASADGSVMGTGIKPGSGESASALAGRRLNTRWPWRANSGAKRAESSGPGSSITSKRAHSGCIGAVCAAATVAAGSSGSPARCREVITRASCKRYGPGAGPWCMAPAASGGAIVMSAIRAQPRSRASAVGADRSPAETIVSGEATTIWNVLVASAKRFCLS